LWVVVVGGGGVGGWVGEKRDMETEPEWGKKKTMGKKKKPRWDCGSSIAERKKSANLNSDHRNLKRGEGPTDLPTTCAFKTEK